MKYFTFILLCSLNFCFARSVDQIIAIVNKDIVLKSDLEDLKLNIKKGVLFDVEYASLFDLKKIKTDEATQIEYLVSEQLFLNHAKKNGLYEKAKSQLDSEIAKIAEGNGLSLDSFKKEIVSQGVSYEDYKNFILKSLIRKRIIDSEITSKIEVSESDIIQYLLQNGYNQFEPRYQYTISHIVVEGDDQTTKVLNTLKTGSFFDALKYSENQENKGLLGTFKEEELAKPFRASVKDLKLSEVSNPISLNGKIYFIKLDDKKRISTLQDSPEVRKARLTLIQNSIATEVQAWLEEKRQTNHIVLKTKSEG